MRRTTSAALLLALSGCGGDAQQAVIPLSACEPRAGTPVAQTGKIDVGGFGLYVDIQGFPIAGRPTIVFDAGGGEDHTPWQAANVQQTIAQSNLTISYDRAGLGQSDESNLPKTDRKSG